jgi:hypothetical protein
VRLVAPAMGWADTTAMDAPEVRYAKSGDVSIAYSVGGDGPFDVIFVSGWVFIGPGVRVGGSACRLLSQARLVLKAHRVRQARDGPV